MSTIRENVTAAAGLGKCRRSHTLTDTKVHLYRTYILPVLLYGCETWTVRKTLAKRLDAFDTWCLWKILRIPYTRHTTNNTVRSITGCLPVSEKVKSFRLRFFGHLARSAPEEDHDRVIAAALRPPPDWRRPVGRPGSTWLRAFFLMKTFSPRTLGSTRHGGRQRTGVIGLALLGVRHQEEEAAGQHISLTDHIISISGAL